ncbi:MAG: hypothetical protein IH899_18940, partial [Planctomycetes bacterium]|nr:hypothetical protein [Planctomycetota bacterium]
ANRLDMDARTTVANLILNRQAKGTGENPDLCLSIWIELCSEQQAEILRTLLFSGDTSDENRKRIWLQIEENRSELGQVFFTEVLLEVFRLHECPETLRAALDAQSRINELFQTKDESYMLGKVLLEAFVSTPSKEAQNRLVDWLKSLGVQDVLKELATLGTLSDEDLEVLRTAFPKSRHLKKMKTEKDT